MRTASGSAISRSARSRPGTGRNVLDKSLWARNKWLLAHADSSEAKDGAYVGLKGENIDIKDDVPFRQ